MFSYKVYLRIGAASADNSLTLAKEDYELASCRYTFSKQIDTKGEVQTRSSGGLISISISSIPTRELLEWAINPRRNLNATIIFCDDSGIPIEKISLEKTVCISMNISYTREGKAYTSASYVLSAEKMTMGRITFENRWLNN